AGAGELFRNGDVTGFGHSRGALGAGVAQDQDIVGGDVEVGVVEAGGHVFEAVEDDGAAFVLHERGGGGGALEEGAAGGEVAARARWPAAGGDRVIARADDGLTGHVLGSGDHVGDRFAARGDAGGVEQGGEL